MSGAVPAVAVVVASVGGPRLARALEATAWAAERVVLDAAGRLTNETLPDGVGRLGSTLDLEGSGRAPWLFLVAEDERPDATLAAAIGAAAAGAPAAWRVARELRVVGAGFHLRRSPVRLAPRAGARLALGAGLVPCLDTAASPGGRLAGAITIEGPRTLDEAMAALDGEAAAMAALLERAGARPTVARFARAATSGAVAVLAARASGAAGLARVVAAALHGYRSAVAVAMLWERSHRRLELA